MAMRWRWPGKLIGPALAQVFQADFGKDGLYALCPFDLGNLLKQQRVFCVLCRREYGNQVECLKNETNIIFAELGKLLLGERVR